MSWRLLIFTVIVFAGIATALGLQAGDYLIERVPVQANIPNVTELDPPAEYDALGHLITPQPMQPLLDGTQGLASDKPNVDWKVKKESLDVTLKNEEKSAMYAEENQRLSGVITQGSTSSNQTFQPIRRQETTQGNAGDNQAWVGAFNQAMAQCRTMGFNERPGCISRVRNQYCGGNNAWGKVPDCPAR
ncbi:hypothetical protein AAEX37_00048 [Oligella sp. MSHR50489EDL]|uniref:hypothetical protein n=1 Tax=Oligella sp. MSHR50489EDL TaxID=3139409 RepID=UPI003D816777